MSRLSDFLSWVDSVGGDRGRWEAALKDTIACRETAVRETTSIGRLKSYYACRKGKRLPPK